MSPKAPPQVVALEPGLLDDRRAGEFLCLSVAWLRAQRLEDHARVSRGEAPNGPAWIVIGRSVFYRPEDLREWIAARAVLRGKVSFDKRQPATPLEADGERVRQ
jgi:hypothetical protein